MQPLPRNSYVYKLSLYILSRSLPFPDVRSHCPLTLTTLGAWSKQGGLRRCGAVWAQRSGWLATLYISAASFGTVLASGTDIVIQIPACLRETATKSKPAMGCLGPTVGSCAPRWLALTPSHCVPFSLRWKRSRMLYNGLWNHRDHGLLEQHWACWHGLFQALIYNWSCLYSKYDSYWERAASECWCN